MAIRQVGEALAERKPVAGNVRLEDGWERIFVRHYWPYWFRPLRRRWFLQHGAELYHHTEDLEELFRIRLAGKGESRGLMLLDEAHNWMNARSWTAEDRKAIVKFFSQHRKLGWDVDLIAQHPEMIDKQVRNLCEYIVYLRNFKKTAFLGIGFPINLFLAVTTWHASQRVVIKRQVMRLSWHRHLYDTNETYGGLVGDDAEGGAIWLPSPPAERMAAATRTDVMSAPGPAARPPASTAAEAADESGELDAWEPVAALDPPAMDAVSE